MNSTLGPFFLSEGGSHTGQWSLRAVLLGACSLKHVILLLILVRAAVGSQWSCSGISPSGQSLEGSECLVKTHVNDHRESQLCPLVHRVT